MTLERKTGKTLVCIVAPILLATAGALKYYETNCVSQQVPFPAMNSDDSKEKKQRYFEEWEYRVSETSEVYKIWTTALSIGSLVSLIAGSILYVAGRKEE